MNKEISVICICISKNYQITANGTISIIHQQREIFKTGGKL